MPGPSIIELLWVARRAIVNAAAHGSWSAEPAVAAVIGDLDRHSAASAPPQPGPLADAVAVFRLSEAETSALAVVAAVEVDPAVGAIIARVQGGDEPRPSVGTLVELLGFEALESFLPTSTLISNVLVELVGDGPLAYRPVRCPTAVWVRLVGDGVFAPAPPVDAAALVLPAALRAEAVAAAAWLTTTRGLLVLWGRPGSGRQALAHAILGLAGVAGADVAPGSLGTRGDCAALERDARWIGVAPVVVGEDGPDPGAQAWLERSNVPRVWIQTGCPDWLTTTPAEAPVRIVQVPDPDLATRTMLWRRALSRVGWSEPAEPIAERYRFGPGRIGRVIELARTGAEAPDHALRAAIAATARPGIAVLAERLAPRARDELVLAAPVAREFELAIGWARSHEGWYRDWQLSTGVAKARGLTCLFAGPPGTGKTLAAQVLTGAIDRDLYRVDLSQAVSKWLGETEKNLGRLFDEAHDAGAVLFFDEADALFARRTTVRDSHDRYANLETGYLLQRLESHAGVVVLATNRRQDLDSAFLRRFDVVVEFAPPDVDARARLWRRHLPAGERCAPDLELTVLAHRFELSGGQIRNAVMSAIARLVMEAGGATAVLALPHLVAGATRELVRAGRLVNPAEYCEWADTVRAALAGPVVQ